MKVIKRDGTIVDFKEEKILTALKKTNDCTKEMTEEDLKRIVTIIVNKCNRISGQISVEDVQDIVEDTLLKSKFNATAKSYILYRDMRTRNRDNKSILLKKVAKKINGSNIVNQNANVDEHSFGGRKGEANNELMKWFALNNCMSKMSRDNHMNNEIYIHDLDSYAVGMHNCLSIPFDKLLANGFNTRQTDIRPASSINTAFQLVAVIFQLQSLQQFGGVSATHLDWTMIPYVRKSFYKHYLDGMKFILNENVLDDFYKIKDSGKVASTSIDDPIYKNFEKAYNYALEMTTRELNQAVEGMYHNLNTLQSRSGNQLPFTSINYGTCTSTEGRMVIKALLEGSIKGVGKLHKTPIFPCGIFQYMKGVNDKPETPNYDLYQLALQSTAKRLYPNYANVDWSGNAGYDRNDPNTYFSTMGALAGHEHLYIKIDNNEPIDITIKDFFNYCKTGKLENVRPCQIYFSKESFLKKGNKHLQQKTNIKKGSGVYAITYLPEDVTYIGSSSDVNRRLAEHRCKIKLSGGLDSGARFNDSNLDNYKFEVLEYTDDYKLMEEKYIQRIPNINYKGVNKKYYKSINTTQDILTKPVFKYDLSKQQELINLEDLDIKVLDRDNKWVHIKHVFKNDKLNTPLMMHIYYKEFDKEYCLSCTEDHPLWTGNTFTKAENIKIGDKIYRADNLELEVTKVTYHWEAVDSYDIGTETGSFIGSDIIMHNCRTANGFDINGFGQLKDGRGNICPVTIVMPTLAMEAKEEYENQKPSEGAVTKSLFTFFMERLDKKIHEAKDMLIERFDYICNQSPESARFMYENNTMEGYIPEEGIRSALKHGTLALGQIGMAETLQILVNCDHTQEAGMKLAKEIEQLFKDRCAEFKQQYKLNFGVYYTPAENLCYTSMQAFKEKYGVIKNVSDKEFFTNSIHVPVWIEMSPFKKIDIESQLTGYSSAGCITYVELDSGVKNNIKALETIVTYAMEHDIPYFAVNVPNDTCLNCGYCDEIGNECPECGGKDIQRLRRVTGYLTGNYTTAFNLGKQQEVKMRVKHR